MSNLRHLLVGLLALAACGRGGSDASAPTSAFAGAEFEGRVARRAPATEAPAAAAAAPKQGGAEPGGVTGALDAVAADSGAPPTLGAAGGTTAQPAAPMLIRTGTASVEVDSLDPAVARVRALAARLGGYVGNTSLAAGREQVRAATLELKLPAARFDAALAGLQPLGRVDSVGTEAEDVGEEFVDVTARVGNARRLEARLLTLLERRADKLADVLSVERELARVREEIERYDGRLRYLRARVALSTLVVTVHERVPLVGTSPAGRPVADAFRQAWRNFVGVTAGAIAASGVLVPLGALAWVAWRLAERARRRRAAARPA